MNSGPIRRTRTENFLTAIEQLCDETEDRKAATNAIARSLGLSSGTVSSTLRRLAEEKLIIHVPYEGARLTREGRLQARRVLRRQRLIELFLNKTLELAWEGVAEEARQLEPVTSEHLVSLMDEFLDHPKFDPHGDPIPYEDGTLPVSETIALATCPSGTAVVLHRVKEQSELLLRFLREQGLEVGSQFVVEENSEVAGLIRLETDNGLRILGHTVAAQLLVRPVKAKF